MKNKMSVTVVIPTLNEIDGIKAILPKIQKKWADEWFIIDGGSIDGTIEEAKKYGFKVVHQKSNGLGAGYREAVKLAKSDYVLFFHPDGNCIPEDIVRLIEKTYEGDYDLVQISRFGYGGVSIDDTPLTSFGNHMFTFLVNTFFGGRLTDALFGFKIIKKKIFQSLELDGEFQTAEQQVSIRVLKRKLNICEIGGVEPKRIGGEAKMKPLTTGAALSIQIIKEFIFWKF